MISQPTAAEFKARYPRFSTVGDPLADAVLADAMAQIDDRWDAGDQRPAVMAYAAHLLTSEGHGGASITVGGQTVTTSGVAQMVSVGDVKIGFAGAAAGGQAQGGGAATQLDYTPFGRVFMDLRRRQLLDFGVW